MKKAKFVVSENQVLQGAEVIEGLYTYSLDLHKTNESGKQVIGLGVYASIEELLPWKRFAADLMTQSGYTIE